MPTNEGLFIALDGTTLIRHVHTAVAAYQLGSPQSPRYERTTRLDAEGRVIFQQHPGSSRSTLISDLDHSASQAPMPAQK